MRRLASILVLILAIALPLAACSYEGPTIIVPIHPPPIRQPRRPFPPRRPPPRYPVPFCAACGHLLSVHHLGGCGHISPAAQCWCRFPQ